MFKNINILMVLMPLKISMSMYVYVYMHEVDVCVHRLICMLQTNVCIICYVLHRVVFCRF